MEQFLAQCGNIFTAEYPLFFSALIAGLLGSVSHCSIMCSPTVAAHMLYAHNNNESQYNMVFYHLGKITTYIALGVGSLWVGQLIFSDTLNHLSGIMLIIAGVTFIVSALQPKKTHKCCDSKLQQVFPLINKLKSFSLQYFTRGMLMGFMPCGMLLSILLMVSTTNNVLYAIFVMLLFGLSTIPALQFSGFTLLFLGKKHPDFSKKFGRIIMVINGFALSGIGLANLH